MASSHFPRFVPMPRGMARECLRASRNLCWSDERKAVDTAVEPRQRITWNSCEAILGALSHTEGPKFRRVSWPWHHVISSNCCPMAHRSCLLTRAEPCHRQIIPPSQFNQFHNCNYPRCGLTLHLLQSLAGFPAEVASARLGRPRLHMHLDGWPLTS